MKGVLFTGSFDPVTRGHEDVIARLSHLFDEVYVTVFLSDEKPGFFPPEYRLALLAQVCKKFPNVSVDMDRGRVVDYVKRKGISLIVRAVRDTHDLAYEHQMAAYNRAHGQVETLLLTAAEEYAGISSREVRRRLLAKEDASPLLPAEIAQEVSKNWENYRILPE